MSRRLVPFMLAIFVATASAGSLGNAQARASASESPCGFGRGDDIVLHLVTRRENISCNGARRVLRDLRGNSTMIPMACDKSRSIKGWRLTKHANEPTLEATTFVRGVVVIVYQRSIDKVRQCELDDSLDFDGGSGGI